jgi:type I restriction enzyme, R subunit
VNVRLERSAAGRAARRTTGFGGFVRKLVGLDRVAVNAGFGEFLATGTATSTQIEFVDRIIGHMTDQGIMALDRFYEPPFTDIAPTGPDQVFDAERVTRLFAQIQAMNESAVARVAL